MESWQFHGLAELGIAAHAVRSAYEILKHKKALKPTRLSFWVIFVNMVLLWASWVGLCIVEADTLGVAGALRYLGVTLSCLGAITFSAGLYTIRSLESYEGALITAGVYSVTRHPMYLGFILWLVGLPLAFAASLPLILSCLFIPNVMLWRHLEEKELDQRYSHYREYKKTTVF